ncbi:MAG: membrane protein insertase YidC [Phycisphaerae bacterium]|nr:membrane protein insertase YidC [Phycisphaerae bacterium]
METDFRRLIFAMFVAFAVFIGYRLLEAKFFPSPSEPPPSATEEESPTPVATSPAPITSAPTTTTTAPTTAAAITTSPTPLLSLVSAEDVGPITLGGDEGDALRLVLDPHGGSVATLELFARDKKGQFVHRAELGGVEPYKLLSAVPSDEPRYFSFSTHRVWIKEYGNESWKLGSQPWQVAPGPADTVTFTTALCGGDGRELLRFTKTYRLRAGRPVFEFDLSVENLGPEPLTVSLDQDGPLGIRKEHLQYDMRQLLTAQYAEGAVELNKGYKRDKLAKATRAGEPIRLLEPDQQAFIWTALTNKYFGVYTRPLPKTGHVQDFVAAVSGLVADERTEENLGDLRARIKTVETALPAGGQVDYTFEVYAGAKDAGTLAAANPDYADRTKLYYQLAQSADQRCCCTFLWLQNVMVWLLETVHVAVRNYGVAIIILVLIVRSLLHPLTVWQQKSMFRMQDSMAKLQPKMSAIKEKYANDRVKQNQEMMKMWGEAGVNPASNFVSFLPLFIQMPIFVALWTALNTDVNLRHAPFLPWWITDLSAPDAAWVFAPPGITIPFLSLAPYIGKWFTNIPSLNLLPILMGVSMWLQQKYMPKPHMQAKLEAAKEERAAGKRKSGMSPEDQRRQQQIMMYMMSIMFPLMLYHWPSGLSLYWMSTNVFGICESLIVRKQLAREKETRRQADPQPPKKAGLVSRIFKRMASQAEELQRKADELTKTEAKKKEEKKNKKKR